jgi:hypothetical protein
MYKEKLEAFTSLAATLGEDGQNATKLLFSIINDIPQMMKGSDTFCRNGSSYNISHFSCFLWKSEVEVKTPAVQQTLADGLVALPILDPLLSDASSSAWRPSSHTHIQRTISRQKRPACTGQVTAMIPSAKRSKKQNPVLFFICSCHYSF